MKKFLANRWFLLVLLAVLVAGMTATRHLHGVVEHKTLRDFVVASVMFLMALPLEPRTIWKIVRRPVAPLTAMFVSFGILPLAAWVAAWPLAHDLGQGLLVAATTPCTLASAAVWTRRAGGNDAVATMATIATNASCFLVTPLWLSVLIGQSADSVRFDFLDSVGQLGRLVVLPMVVAQLARLWPPLGLFAHRRKVPVGVLSQCGILYMVLIGAVQTGDHLFGPHAAEPPWFDLLLMLVAVAAVHLGMFGFGWWLSGVLKLTRGEQIAVAFSGSMKTLMVGLKIALDLQVSILPMVTFHVGQLLIDTMIADRLARSAEHNALDPESRST